MSQFKSDILCIMRILLADHRELKENSATRSLCHQVYWRIGVERWGISDRLVD
ncbi:hypothetical protein [Pantanalinema rosaneae]|uniref:hypothetical protein n=1 Tax=Pantanalinema rosaneae TaxID=1620701 RepID=UPI003D6F7DF5